MLKPFIAALTILIITTFQAPAWTMAHTPETARELRKQRAQKNLEKNRRNLDRLAREADLPPVDETLIAEYSRIISYLANPARQGRAPGTDGIIDAENFLQAELTRLGLRPAFDLTETAEDGSEAITLQSTFLQPMPIGSTLAATTQTMSINGTPLIAGEDFEPLAYSGSTAATGQVVFAGYAIVSGPDAYMGFGPSENFKDKIALCLKYEPMDAHGNSKWKDDQDGWSHHSRLTYKVSALERRGASAVLIVSPESANDDSAGLMDSIGSTSPPPSMALRNGGPKFDIPVLSVSPETARRILNGSGHTLGELIDKANAEGVVEDIDSAAVKIEVEIERTKTYTNNIGAVLPGKGDLADELIVVGAHYDHIGYGHFGSRTSSKNTLHPGADDNASGTTGVLIAADQLSDRYALLTDTDHARSILFLLFTAEESGLNGSRFYADNPITDIDRHEIMLNMDMIGRLELDPLEIGGLESSDQLAALVTGTLDRTGIVYDQDTSVGSGRSDHASFEAKKVPNIFFFTGLHDQYHTPEDTVDLVDMEGAVRVATVVAQVAYDAATTHEPFIHEREHNVVDKDNDDKQPKVRIGIIPSNASEGGLLVNRVFDNTSASKAGLQSDDRITHWDGTEITSIESWSPVLLEHKPGDVVKLTVIRDEETLEIDMTLQGIE